MLSHSFSDHAEHLEEKALANFFRSDLQGGNKIHTTTTKELCQKYD